MSSQKTKAHAPLLPPKVSWSQHPLWTALTYLLGLLPICLLWHGNNAFYLDWNNHLWVIGYFGEYVRQHWTFPVTLNTQQLAGMPYPVFYGYLFYPAAGLISAITGCSFALRLVCSLVFLLQVRQVSKTAESIAGDRFLACAITVLVSFATYPLTNLYNRAAITEFVAVSLVTSVCMMWLRIVRTNDTRLLSGAALALTFAMGTHPITAILGGSIIGLSILVSLPLPRDLWKPMGWAAALIALVMAPWIYAVALFGGKVKVSGGWIGFFPNTLDHFATRFSPLPWDPRLGTEEGLLWGTPYLDTQINFALLILAVFLLFRAARTSREYRLAATAFAGFVLVCFLSVFPPVWHLIPRALHFIQFAYRLVTYADLFLLFAVLFLLTGLRRTDRPMMAALAVCLALSSAGVTIKLLHAYSVEVPSTLAGSGWPNSNRDALRSMPEHFYGWYSYAVKSGSRGVLADSTDQSPVSFSVGAQEQFGDLLPLAVPSGGAGRLRTDIQIFPWNRMRWNGREIPFEETFTDANSAAIVDRTPEAGTLEYVLRPDPVWLVLRTLSLWTAGLWAFVLCLSYLRPKQRAE